MYFFPSSFSSSASFLSLVELGKVKIDICDRAMKNFFFFFLISYVVLVVGCYLYVTIRETELGVKRREGVTKGTDVYICITFNGPENVME